MRCLWLGCNAEEGSDEDKHVHQVTSPRVQLGADVVGMTLMEEASWSGCSVCKGRFRRSGHVWQKCRNRVQSLDSRKLPSQYEGRCRVAEKLHCDTVAGQWIQTTEFETWSVSLGMASGKLQVMEAVHERYGAGITISLCPDCYTSYMGRKQITNSSCGGWRTTSTTRSLWSVMAWVAFRNMRWETKSIRIGTRESVPLNCAKKKSCD